MKPVTRTRLVRRLARLGGVSTALLLATALLAAVGPGAAQAAGAQSPAPKSVGGAASLPAGSVQVGALPSQTPLSLTVTLRPNDPVALTSFVNAVSTPGSPHYRQYLARGEFATRFGASASTIAAVTGALRQLGLDPGPVAADHLSIPVRTTAGAAESGLGVQLHQYRLPDGSVHFASATAPKLPGDVAGAVQAVVGLDDLARLHSSGGVVRAPAAQPPPGPSGAPASSAGPLPCAAAVATGAATANQLASAYGIDGLYSAGNLGAGQSIALLEAGTYDASDVATYQSCYGTSTSVTPIPVDGGSGPLGPGTLEATGDIEDLVGLAPQAHILVYETPNLLSYYLDTFGQMVSDDTAKVISTSWGLCEPLLPSGFAASENTIFEMAAAQGQSAFAASADFGSETCYQSDTSNTSLSVSDPSSQPYVTGVGGTTWYSPAGPPPNESTWRDQVGASGGGISGNGTAALNNPGGWPMPSWQTGPGVDNSYSSGTPCGAATGNCREDPDVSALATYPYYSFYCTGGDCAPNGVPYGWNRFYGTSFGTPLWAAITALSNESCSGEPSVGFANPALYEAAAGANSPFNDITSGNNDFLMMHGGAYPATTGYDMATGLGTPIVSGTDGIAAQLCSLVLPIVTSVSPDHGPITGGNQVTISGAGLDGATSVKFGSTEATSFSVDSASSITATVPAGSAGTVDVTVTTPAGSTPLAPADRYTYAPVTVSGVSPQAGSSAGGTTITITGTGFDTTGGATTVDVGSNPATGVSCVSSTTCTSITPAGTGLQDVTVTTPAGTSPTSSADRFAYVSPIGRYYPLTPCRILDTRSGLGHSGAIGPNSKIDLQITGSVAGACANEVPAGATAVVMNVTEADATESSYLTVWPQGATRPTASNLNFEPGTVVPNLVQVGLSSSGMVSIYNNQGNTDVVADIEGYVGPATSDSSTTGQFNSLSPMRILDTRTPLGGHESPLGQNQAMNLQVTGQGGVPSNGVSAVVLNLTVTDTTAPSYLTLWPAGASQPLASNLNFTAGQTVPNRVIVPVGTGGKVSIYNDSGSTNVIADVGGWYTDGSDPTATGDHFTPASAPVRILDTRNGTGWASGPIGANSAIFITVAGGSTPAPADADAIVANVTVTDTSAPSYLTVFPNSTNPVPPTISDLNWSSGATIANLVVTKVGTSDMWGLYNKQGSTNAIADVEGWYSP